MTYGATAVAKTNHSLAAPGVMNGMNQVWRSLCGSARDADTSEDAWVYRGLRYSIKQDIGRLLDSAVPEKPAEDTEETGWRWRRAITWHRALVTALVAVVVFVGGTSLAFVRPQSALAAPFRGIAEMLAQVTVVAGDIIDDVRGATAGYERQTVSTALQAMRVVDRIATVAPVTAPTNDMSDFPSAANSLYPEYLDRRYSQFNYTVSAYGNVTVDTSVATTDAFLERIMGWLASLPAED